MFLDGIQDAFGEGGLTNTFQAMEAVRLNVLGSAGDRCTLNELLDILRVQMHFKLYFPGQNATTCVL